MEASHYKKSVLHELRRLKQLADSAIAQLHDDEFFRTLDAETNSVAINVKHIAGNLCSRWRDFLTTDGEKPDRHRDREFILDAQDTQEQLLERWEKGWALQEDTIASLRPEEFEQAVTIRGEPHSVVQAINRNVSHLGYHVGQIVLSARNLRGSGWQTLSIPRGQSREFNSHPASYLRER